MMLRYASAVDYASVIAVEMMRRVERGVTPSPLRYVTPCYVDALLRLCPLCALYAAMIRGIIVADDDATR